MVDCPSLFGSVNAFSLVLRHLCQLFLCLSIFASFCLFSFGPTSSVFIEVKFPPRKFPRDCNSSKSQSLRCSFCAFLSFSICRQFSFWTLLVVFGCILFSFFIFSGFSSYWIKLVAASPSLVVKRRELKFSELKMASLTLWYVS